ncbi:hypothetical protein L7F22_012781 [Adiantum nelumboides]|nr:hypothetical protein [Adiantum nelumboides]
MLLNARIKSSIDILPVLFIPQSCKKIIKGSSDVYGTFLKPLLDELELLFLDGVDVMYVYPTKNIFINSQGLSKFCKVRAMVMMVTGDHPAQCKIGLFKNGGKDFCRRDKAQATLVHDSTRNDGRYVYDENRRQVRYPPPRRTIDEMTHALNEAQRCCTPKEKDVEWKKGGLSGESVLWKLFDLYAFDLSLDLVYDPMHTLSLNLFKKYISHLFEQVDTPLKKEIDTAVMVVTKAVPTSLRYGHWPNSPSIYFESFKAEENQKFVQWCLPRDHGWSLEDMKVVRTLLQSWRVRNEEIYGANSSPLEHVAGNCEMLDDVLRHGLHDRFWCYIFEHLVKAYSSIKTNNMEDEASFVKFYLRRFFTRAFQAIRSDTDGMLPMERFLKKLHCSLSLSQSPLLTDDALHECSPSHMDGLLVVSSIEKARCIWNDLLKYGTNSPCVRNILLKGVAISKKRCSYREPTSQEIAYLKHFWSITEESFAFGEVTTYQKVFFKDEVFKVGTYVTVKVDNGETVEEARGHWKACITSLFPHSVMENTCCSLEDNTTSSVL